METLCEKKTEPVGEGNTHKPKSFLQKKKRIRWKNHTEERVECVHRDTKQQRWKGKQVNTDCVFIVTNSETKSVFDSLCYQGIGKRVFV